MTHGNSRQSFPLFIVEPLRDGLGNPLVDFPGETRGPAAKHERPPGRERREGFRHRDARPPDGRAACRKAPPGRRQASGMQLQGTRWQTGRRRIAGNPAKTTGQGRDPWIPKGAGRVADHALRTRDAAPWTRCRRDCAITGQDPCGDQCRHPVRSPQSRGTAFSNQECRALTFEDAVGGFASQKFAGVSVAGIDGGLDRSGNFGVADGALRHVATVQLA